MSNLILPCNFFSLYLHYNYGKGFKVIKNVKILRFEGEWDKFSAMIWFCRLSVTKHFEKSKKISKIGPKNFDISFSASFDCYCYKLILEERLDTSHF